MNSVTHTRTQVCKGVGDDGVPCKQTNLVARGYCERCYNVLRSHCIANGSWPRKRGEEIPKPPMKPWTWEGDEDALAAQFGGQSEPETNGDRK